LKTKKYPAGNKGPVRARGRKLAPATTSIASTSGEGKNNFLR